MLIFFIPASLSFRKPILAFSNGTVTSEELV